MSSGPGLETTLTADQVARINRYGSRRRVPVSEILFRPGQHIGDFFVIESGMVEIERPATPDSPPPY